MLHRCQILTFENSLFYGLEQNAYYSEAYSEHCQTSKIECFEKIVESYEPLIVFANVVVFLNVVLKESLGFAHPQFLLNLQIFQYYFSKIFIFVGTYFGLIFGNVRKSIFLSKASFFV